MPYPESFIGPMREELTRLGVKELRTAEAVDLAVRGTHGTLMVVVNSMCGCAAGRARPGVALALQHHVTPDVVATVFAGGDIEATERARSYFAPYRSIVAVDCAAPRRQGPVHAGAPPDREPDRRSDRARADRRVRQVLRPGRALAYPGACTDHHGVRRRTPRLVPSRTATVACLRATSSGGSVPCTRSGHPVALMALTDGRRRMHVRMVRGG